MSNTLLNKNLEEHWYAMRVTYGRELKVETALAGRVQTYVPKCYKIIQRFGHRKYELTSSINNLIFIHASEEAIKDLKKKDQVMAECLRFIIDAITEKPMVVKDKQMEDFIKVSSLPQEQLLIMNIEEGKALHGKRVRIIKGELTGVEGRVMRIQGNKKVVVYIEQLVAIGITFIPPSWLIKLD